MSMWSGNLANLCRLSVSTGYDASATTIVLNSQNLDRIPAEPWFGLYWDAFHYNDASEDPKAEYVQCTARTGNSLDTVVRAQRGTSATTKNTAGGTYVIDIVWSTYEAADVLTRIQQVGISVKDAPYNAEGDGITDDTTAIQAAIDAAYTAGAVVYIPPGTYLTSSALTVYSGSRLVGAGRDLTILHNVTSNGVTTSLVGAETYSDGIEIAHLGFYGPNNSSTTQIGILLSQCRRARLNDIYVRQMRHAVKLTNASYFNSVRDLYAYRCGTAVRLDDHASKSNKNNFYNINFTDSGLWALDAIELCGYGNDFYGVYAAYPGGNSVIRLIAVNAGANEFFGLYGESATLQNIIDNTLNPLYVNHVWGFWDDGSHNLFVDPTDQNFQVIQQARVAIEDGTVSVKSYGATGDGTTDDTTAINLCITESEGKTILFPKGTYRVTSPINCTLSGHQSITIQGAGQGEYGTIILGDTGGEPVFDVTANLRCTFRDFQVEQGVSDPSEIGMMFIRNTALDQSAYNYLENITLDLDSDTAANGGVGTVGLYNVCSEIMTCVNCTFLGDFGMWLDRTNTLDIASNYQTCQTSAQNSSISAIRMIGGYLTGGEGPALHASYAADLDLSCGFTRQTSSTPCTYAASLETCVGVKWIGTIDQYPTSLRCHGMNQSVEWSPYMTQNASYPVIFNDVAGGGLSQSVITIRPTAAGRTVSTDLFYSDSSTRAVIRNCIFNVYSNCTSIDASYSTSVIQSTIIISDDNLADWTITFPVALRYNLELRCIDGTKIWGDVSTGARQVIDGWYQDDVPGTQGATVMTRGSGTDGSVWIAPRPGSVTGIGVYSNDARTAGTLTVSAYKNGGSLSFTAVIDDDPTSFATNTQAKDVDTFAAGDRLAVYLTTSSFTPAASADIRAWLEVEM